MPPPVNLVARQGYFRHFTWWRINAASQNPAATSSPLRRRRRQSSSPYTEPTRPYYAAAARPGRLHPCAHSAAERVPPLAPPAGDRRIRLSSLFNGEEPPLETLLTPCRDPRLVIPALRARLAPPRPAVSGALPLALFHPLLSLLMSPPPWPQTADGRWSRDGERNKE
jgi:hypothetical protein